MPPVPLPPRSCVLVCVTAQKVSPATRQSDVRVRACVRVAVAAAAQSFDFALAQPTIEWPWGYSCHLVMAPLSLPLLSLGWEYLGLLRL